MKRLSIALAAAAAVMVLWPGAASAHKVHYDSSVTIDFFSDPYDPYGTTFFGTVDSEKNACKKNRTVKVGNDAYEAKKGLVLATGSRVKGIPQIGLEINKSTVISSDEALFLEQAPATMAIGP